MRYATKHRRRVRHQPPTTNHTCRQINVYGAHQQEQNTFYQRPCFRMVSVRKYVPGFLSTAVSPATTILLPIDTPPYGNVRHVTQLCKRRNRQTFHSTAHDRGACSPGLEYWQSARQPACCSRGIVSRVVQPSNIRCLRYRPNLSPEPA